MLLLGFFNNGYNQIKIGDNPESLDASSLLELESSSKVLVISRVSEATMLQLTPLTGAMVYNTDAACIYYYNGAAWISLCTDGVSVANASLSDNGDGTFTYIGEDNVPISFYGAEENLTTFIENEDGTYTYTNELGAETVLTVSGNVQETTSTLADNNDGTYTYTDENGIETLVDTNSTIEEFMGNTGSVLFAGADGKVDENNSSIYWDNSNERLGVKTNDPNSTISIDGSMSTPIDFVGGTAIGLGESNHTALINGSGNVTLFLPAANVVTGRMYIVKINPSITLSVPSGYRDSSSNTLYEVPNGINVIWFQSNGFTWEQVN